MILRTMKFSAVIFIFFLTMITKNAYSNEWVISDVGLSFYLNNNYDIFDIKYSDSRIIYQLKKPNNKEFKNNLPTYVLCVVNVKESKNGRSYVPDSTSCWHEQN